MELVQLSHKIRLNPTEEQKNYFWRAAGVARFTFNWGLERYNKTLEENRNKKDGTRERVSGRSLKKEFNAIKEQEFPWVSEVTTWAYQGAFDDLQSAFRNYFDKHKKGLLPKSKKPRKDNKPNGWPRFKSRDVAKPTFYLANIAFRCEDNWIKMPHIGWVNMAESLRFDGKIMRGVVSYVGGHWYISIGVEMEHTPKYISRNDIDAVGLDLGIKHLGMTSDGVLYDNPKAFNRMQRKLRRLQRSFARMEKGSNNWHKMKAKIAKLYKKMSDIRLATSHEMTTELVEEYNVIAIEDLNVKGMMSNRRLSKAIADAAFFEKRRQLEYKTKLAGAELVVIDRWFPSSKRCNNCGAVNAELKLSDRAWECSECETYNHRDGNAAMNIRDEGLRVLYEQSSPEYSHGDVKRLTESLA